MTFRHDPSKEDAHLLAEECRIFSATLSPEDREYFFDSLVEELSRDRDKAIMARRAPVQSEPNAMYVLTSAKSDQAS